MAAAVAAGRARTAGPPAAAAAAPVFASVLCAVSGSAQGVEPVRQAALLTGPDGLLDLLCVVHDAPAGAGTRELLDRARADRALARAVGAAVEYGAVPDTRMLAAPDVTDALLAAAAGQDLLVLGAHDGARAADVLLGRVGAAVLRRATCPVLLARSEPHGERFPAPLLLADDGTPSAQEAARLTAQLAAAHGCPVHVAAPAAARERIAGHVAAIEAAGVEAVVSPVKGPAHRAIVELAGELEASLVVVGSRGLRGLRAMSSVSERVAQKAPCSVLVARAARRGR